MNIVKYDYLNEEEETLWSSPLHSDSEMMMIRSADYSLTPVSQSIIHIKGKGHGPLFQIPKNPYPPARDFVLPQPGHVPWAGPG